MSNRKFIAQGVAAVIAATGGLAVPTAHAALSFFNNVARILPCSIAGAVDQPACSSSLAGNAAAYQIDFTIGVLNPTSTATPPPAPVPVTLSTDSLDAAFGPNKWALVASPTPPTGLTDPATKYDGKTNLTLGTATLASGAGASTTLRVEAVIDGGIPSVVAKLSGGESGSKEAKVYVPAKRSTDAPVGSSCTLASGATEKVVNGNFKNLSTDLNFPVNSSATNPIPGTGFWSEVPLTGQGFGVYDENKTISLVRGTSVSTFAQQLPLPSGSSVNWLRHGGGTKVNGTPTDDVAQKFWNQNVTGLTAGKTYQIEAWFSNISDPASNNSSTPPIIRFMVDGVEMNGADLTLSPETAETGDTWYKMSGTFEAKAASAVVSIVNKQKGWFYNQVAVTDISLKECVPGTVTTSTATATGPASTTTTSSGGSTTATTSGGGGGGGALGLGALALFGVAGLLRRRARR